MSNTLFDKQGHSITSAILSDKEINDYIQDGFLINKSTFASTSVEASSYDVRVGKKGIIGGTGNELDLTGSYLELQPGSYAGIVSYEKFKLPTTIAARLGSKRALSYEGIILLTGSVIDPGYEGHLIFGLYNASQRKVLLKYGKKICNVVFEKLSIEPNKVVSPDPSLLEGNFPDEFVQKMYSMEVLPWMQISDRVKQIETITKDILDLRSKYEDVLKPIRELTDNIKSLSHTVQFISEQTKTLGLDLGEANRLINENGRQISQLTQNLQQVSGKQVSTESLVDELRINMKSQSVWNKILGALVLLVLGALISWLVTKALQ